MKTEIMAIKGSWREILNNCRSTVGKPDRYSEPTDAFKTGILIAEHSTIRSMWIKWRWHSIKSWIATHWSRHKWECFISTQRTDRTGIDRDKLPQAAPVDFIGEANIQHLIDTWRKRLCHQAAPETRHYAEDMKVTLRDIPDTKNISDVLVPNCVYRAGCPEMTPCGHWIKFITDRPEAVGASISERYRIYNEWVKKV